MAKALKTHELNCKDPGWMIQLGKVGRTANKIVVHNFKATWSNIAFVKVISSDYQLRIVGWDDDLVLVSNKPKPGDFRAAA